MDSYTGYSLSEADRKKVSEWGKEHTLKDHANMFRTAKDGSKYMYTGAIGGGLSIRFTDTTIIQIVTACCGLTKNGVKCDGVLDLTDITDF